ncbi:MAG: hypothetical protein HY291_09350 [Planctomycetes bacterium]|nr:hypothetical protein [Planctomycetota bacterium]
MIKKLELPNIPDHVLYEMAAVEAYAGVVAEHRRLGMPLTTWRDGKVVKIPADQVPIPDPNEVLERWKKSQKEHGTSKP